MRRLAFAIAAALVAGPAAAQPADDAIGQLLNVPPPAAEPATPSPPTPAAVSGETVSTSPPAAASPASAPAQTAVAPTTPAVPAPAADPAATPALAAATPVPSPAVPATPPPETLAAGSPVQTTGSSTEVTPAQAAALQAAVMATAPAPPTTASASKDPPSASPAYTAVSSVTRPASAQSAASGLAGPSPAGDADEEAVASRQGDNTYSSWSDASSRPGSRPTYGRYGVSRPTYASSNPGLPYTRYSQVTRPVQLAETGVSADQPMTPQDLAYESRMRQAFTAAENAQGPLDGHWVLSGPDGRLYAFQVVDRGQTLEGVWTDLRRPPGSLETTGLIDQLSRDGDALTLRFTAPRRGGPVILTLRSAPGGVWTGQMSGAAAEVSLRRD